MDINDFEKEIGENCSSFYESNKGEAEDILKDEDKMERLFQQLESKLKTISVAGGALSYVPLMMSLVRSYVKKEYTDPPVGSMVTIVLALLYFVLPTDLIPDVIPGIGHIDDALVVAGCIAVNK